MHQFLVGTFIISLSLVFGGGAAVATNHPVWGFALTATGAGWMGIIWGTIIRQLTEDEWTGWCRGGFTAHDCQGALRGYNCELPARHRGVHRSRIYEDDADMKWLCEACLEDIDTMSL